MTTPKTSGRDQLRLFDWRAEVPPDRRSGMPGYPGGVEEQSHGEQLRWPGVSQIETNCDRCHTMTILMEPPTPTICGACGYEMIVRVRPNEG